MVADRSRRFLLLWTLVCVLLAAHAAVFHHVVDDAYISFRYLEHALAGQGLVYNVGERVEGYTNFLWILMLVPCAVLGLELPRFAAALGLVCMAAGLALRHRVAVAELGRAAPPAARGGALVGVVLLCVSGPVAYWAASGLETGVFCLLVVLLLSFLWRRRLWDAIAAGAVGALLCMTRPDGVVYLVAGVGWLLLRGRPAVPVRTRARMVGVLLATFIAVYGPYLCWRLWYYGALLPNTFYAKVGGVDAALPRGLKYVAAFGLVSGIGAVLIATGGVALVRRVRSTSPPDATSAALAWLVGAFAAAGLAFVLLVGGDQLAMFRFMVPISVLALPSLWMAATRGLRTSVTHGLAAVVAAGVILAPSFVGPMVGRVTRGERPSDLDRAIIGQWLAQTQPPQTLVAVVPAGILPYFSRLPTLDLVGLTDYHIARAAVPNMGGGTPGHERYDADYVVERGPDIVFLGACRLRERPLTPEELTAYVQAYARHVPAVGALLAHPEFQRRYVARPLPIAGLYAHAWVRLGRGDP